MAKKMMKVAETTTLTPGGDPVTKWVDREVEVPDQGPTSSNTFQPKSFQEIMAGLPTIPGIDLKEIIARRQAGLGGFTAEESAAQRAQMALGMGRQEEARRRQLLAAQAKAGVKGGAAAAQQARFAEQAAAQRAGGEQELFLRNIAEQQRRLKEFEDVKKAEQFAGLASEITRMQLAQAEAAAQKQLKAAEIAAQGQVQAAKESGCVIATHAVESGAFTRREKLEAIRWCERALHGSWYGEAMRRGYRWIGNRKIAQGKASHHYAEFQRYVRFGNGKDRSLNAAATFVFRSVQMFIIGLFVKE